MSPRLFSARGSADRSELRQEGSGALSRGIASIVLRVTGAALSFAITIALARILGADGLGLYSYAIAIATLGAMLAQMGLPVLMVRETARYKASEQWPRLRGLLVGSSLLVTGVAAICLLLALIFLGFGSAAVDAVDVATIVPALALIPVIAMNNVGGASIRGFGYAIKGQVAEQLLRPGFFLCSLLALALAYSPGWITPSRAMTSHALAGAAAFLLGVWLLKNALPADIRRASSDYSDWPRLKKSLLPLSILAGLQVINGQTDILMLGLFRDAEDVGIYRVAHQSASLVNLTLFAIGLTVEPAIARLHQSGELQKLQHVVTITARLAFGISAAMAIVLVVFGNFLLEAVFGDVFSAAFIPLTILCAGQVALAYAGWSVLLLNMSGSERITAKMTACAAVANIIANLLLIPPFGMYGAAIATASTVFIWKVVLSYIAERTTGVRTVVFPTRSAAGAE